MKRIVGLAEISSFYSSFGTEDVVIRSTSGGHEPFEIAALIPEPTQLHLPIDAPVYIGDRVERKDPRGGVLEYEVSDVAPQHDPFGGDMSHAVVTVRGQGHNDRKYGTVNVNITGGNNQVAFGNETVSMSQNNSVELSELVDALQSIMREAPRDLIQPKDVEELQESIDEAIAVAQQPGAKESLMRRAMRSVRGTVEDIAASATSGANAGVKIWAQAAVAQILALMAGN